MPWHITIRGHTWCGIPDSGELRKMATDKGVRACCEHESLGSATQFLDFLDAMLVEDAAIVTGTCPWRPDHPDLRRLLHK